MFILAAAAAASPLGGLAGGLVSSLSALTMGMDPMAVSLGLGSYNGVLTAIAIGSTFYAASQASALIALLAASDSALVAPALTYALGAEQLPVLTLPFMLSTMATKLVLRLALPSLLPVDLHSVIIPEEQRQQLRRAVAGERQAGCGRTRPAVCQRAAAAAQSPRAPKSVWR